MHKRRKRRQGSRAWKPPRRTATWEAAARAARSRSRAIKQEIKKQDIELKSGAVDSSAWIVDQVVQVAQGIAQNQRTGRTIFVKGVGIRGGCNHSGLGLVNQWIRVIIFVDRQQIADTKPLGTDVMNEATNAENQVLTFLNREKTPRFKILYDRILQMSLTQVTGIVFKHWCPVNDTVGFNGVLSTDMENKHIFVMYRSTSIASAPNLNFIMRTHYTDS